MLHLTIKNMAVIALDLGGTKLSGAIFEPDGTMVDRTVLSLEKRVGDEVGKLIQDLINNLMNIAVTRGKAINSVACCVPGIAFSGSGRVWAPNISGWDDYPLLERIRTAIDDTAIGVVIDNDRACSILGEAWKGNAKGCSDAIFLAVGTGIGAGIMINRNILRGSRDVAGAIGWLALDRPYQEKYIRCGCFEYHASGEGLSAVALEMIRDNPGYEGMLRYGELTAHTIFEAYGGGDEIGLEVVNQAIGYWGMAVANLVSLFNPEKIIFGGGVFGPASRFLDDIMLEARKWSQPVSIGQVKLQSSLLGADAGLYGAAFLALKGKT